MWPSLNLRANVQVDVILRHVDQIDSPKPTTPDAVEFASALAGYTDLDVRLAWRPDRRWEVSLVGQNLLHKHRPELTGFILDSQPSEVRRVIYGALQWKL